MCFYTFFSDGFSDVILGICEGGKNHNSGEDLSIYNQGFKLQQ